MELNKKTFWVFELKSLDFFCHFTMGPALPIPQAGWKLSKLNFWKWCYQLYVFIFTIISWIEELLMLIKNMDVVPIFFTSTCISFHSLVTSYYNQLQKEIVSQITKLNKLSDTYCLWDVAIMLSYWINTQSNFNVS